MLKLCVGAESIADLTHWIETRLTESRRVGRPAEHIHTTRMAPKRATELVDGGSLFWVIKGQVAVRQALLDIRPFTDTDGIGRCQLVLEPVVVEVETRPCRAFQGWRYLADPDAPPDLSHILPDLAAMPEPLRRELRDMGLI